MEYDYDLIVIGAGSVGLKAAHAADKQGLRVALIEADRVGGDDLWRGAIMAKTLVKSAKVFDLVKRSEEFGVHVEKPRVIWNAIKLRLLDVRDEIKKIQRDELNQSKIQLIMGRAEAIDEHSVTVEVKGEKKQLTGSVLTITSGNSPMVPEIDGLQETGFIFVNGLFERPNMPKSLIFIGNGSKLVEMAQAFVRFGTKVTVLCPHHSLLPDEEPEVARLISSLLENEGAKIVLNASVAKVEPGESQKTVHFSSVGVEDSAKAGEIVVSCGAPSEDVFKPVVTFTDPEIARVGLTVEKAQIQHDDVQVWSTPFKTLNRAIIEGETSGFFQVVSTSNGILLGVHIIGPGAGETIAAFVPAVRDGKPISGMDFPHLTLSEIGDRWVG